LSGKLIPAWKVERCCTVGRIPTPESDTRRDSLAHYCTYLHIQAHGKTKRNSVFVTSCRCWTKVVTLFLQLYLLVVPCVVWL